MHTPHLSIIAETSGMGTSRWINNYVKEFPIIKASDDKQNNIITFVDEIIYAKCTNPNKDTTALETEIDRLVYQLYGLTEEEIAIVEGKGPTPNPSLEGGELVKEGDAVRSPLPFREGAGG